MKIILVRHGETQWNAQGRLQGREDVPLSERGLAQAEAAGKALSHYPFSGRGPVIISSPLQRAKETARRIGAQLPSVAGFYEDEALLERDYGAGAGLTLAEREARYPGARYPGLEDRQAAEDRIVRGVQRLAERFAGQDLILVSHGEISHIFLAHLRGDATQTGKSALQNASISSVMYEKESGFAVEYYNQSAAELTAILEKQPRRIILASASPRRQELLQLITPNFDVEVSQVEEIVPETVALAQAPEYLARLKAQDVAARHPQQLVIGSDTGVFVQEPDGEHMLGKPQNEAEACAMLRRLSGRRHIVRTGCCLCQKGEVRSFTEEAVVEFYPLTEAEIQAYVATGSPMDKAGAYGVQDPFGIRNIRRIEGDYYTIMGLPVSRLYREM